MTTDPDIPEQFRCRELTWVLLEDSSIVLHNPRWEFRPVRIKGELIEHVLAWLRDRFRRALGIAGNPEQKIAAGDFTVGTVSYRLGNWNSPQGMMAVLSANGGKQAAVVQAEHAGDFLKALEAAAVLRRAAEPIDKVMN